VEAINAFRKGAELGNDFAQFNLASSLRMGRGTKVGYAMGERMTQGLTAQALWRAVRNKRPQQGLIHHSDRRSQYCAHDYRNLVEQFGMQASMSRKGNCYDNAPMESFWGSRTSWYITTGTPPAPMRRRQSRNTSKAFITDSGVTRASAMFRLWLFAENFSKQPQAA
jgi:putative transposase